jgi:hypothetical protein
VCLTEADRCLCCRYIDCELLRTVLSVTRTIELYSELFASVGDVLSLRSFDLFGDIVSPLLWH